MPTGNNPLLAVSGVADAAVHRFGPKYLERGGPAARVIREAAKGKSAQEAARIAAHQGKGHIAELRQSAEFTARAGIFGEPCLAWPNPVANDPQLDVLVGRNGVVISGAQVGVGSPRYLTNKIRKSLAPQVVVNGEALQAISARHPAVAARARDRHFSCGVEALPLSKEQVEQEAQELLRGTLLRSAPTDVGTAFAIATNKALESFVPAAGVSLLYEVVESRWTGRPLEPGALERAVKYGCRAAARTALQTVMVVDQFLASARLAYNAKLIRAASRGAIWAGGVADVILATASDVLAWARNEIDLNELLTRAGVHLFSAGGAMAAVALALAVTKSSPGWLQGLAVAALGIGGALVGRHLGEAVLRPDRPPQALSCQCR